LNIQNEVYNLFKRFNCVLLVSYGSITSGCTI
jgi:hypothetical protein